MDAISRHELVIFDCDGVIVDSERLSARIDEHVLKSLGWNIRSSQIASLYLGCTQDEFYRDVSTRLGISESWYLEFEGWYEEAFRTELRTVPGVRELIETLRAPYCIASNSSIESISRKLEFCGLSDLFSGRIFSAEMVERPKPAPDIYLAIMESYSVSPSDCLIVEDSPRGVEAAVQAGGGVVALRSDLVDPRTLAAADLIVDSLDKLKMILLEGH